MMKLNNKGVTTIEILICFVLISLIAMSMYSTISAFNEKRIEENYRTKLIIYKNTVTKDIEDDFVKEGLSYAQISDEKDPTTGKRTITVDCILQNGNPRRLVISQQFTKTPSHQEGKDSVDDEFTIKYGQPNNMQEYPLPNLGEIEGHYGAGIYDSSINTFRPCGSGESNCRIVKDLQINNVIAKVSNEKVSGTVESQVLNVYIEFSHPQLENKYAINIVAPINYIVNKSNRSNNQLVLG